MGLTKKGYFTASGILSIILSVTLAFVTIVELLKKGYFGETPTGHGYVTGVGENIIIGYTCLSFSIANFIGGVLMLVATRLYTTKHQKNLVIASSVFTILGACALNLNAVALYLAYGTDDYVEIRQAKSAVKTGKKKQQTQPENLRTSIQALRKMRDNGEITDDEFRYFLFDLIEHKK